MCRLIMLCVIAAVPLPLAFADTSRFVPARFASGLDAAAEEIAFPDYRKDVSLFINCAAKISETGQVTDHFCLDYYGGADTKFRKVTERFIESTKIRPASVDGVPVAVELYFRVFFGRQGDSYAVGVYPNWGDDAERYDLEYQAPQRYDSAPLTRDCVADGGLSRILVNAEGKAQGEVDLIMSYGVPEHYSVCELAFSNAVRNGRYIPAHHYGAPVEAIYVELAGDPSWFTLKTPDGL